MKIPVNELMCLFDADQTCSKGFFATMLRYIDSGDDVGVALSPQLMYNVTPDCDVFNHQNVHFWEMMQPGMDALGFISLTGTNMILRSRALHQAGWFPMNSVTEDWALGMRFKKLGYRCRYVNVRCGLCLDCAWCVWPIVRTVAMGVRHELRVLSVQGEHDTRYAR
jgi:cellulose synthase/poly-beta-1,6-N-acetylglucosamine synthase-like glycosyltransferase